jgi:outer membrane receptor protein involved in Fe transport
MNNENTRSVLTRLRPWACAAAALAALHFAVADAPDAAADAAAGSGSTPWLSPGLRWGTPAAATELLWSGQRAASQWSVRLGLDAAHGTVADIREDAAAPAAPALRAQAQWLYRGWAHHALRLGADAQRTLPLQAADAARIGADAHDDWSLAPGWRLGLGLRAESAADAAASVLPRAALSWQPHPQWQLQWGEGSATPGSVIPTAGERVNGERAVGSEWNVQWHSAPVASGAPGLRVSASLFDASTAAAPRDLFAALQAHAVLPWRGASASVEWLRRDGARSAPQTLLNATLAWAPADAAWQLAASAYNLADHALADYAAPHEQLVRDGRRWQLQLARPF